ncbi:MAG: RelA/SpoT domain protein [Herbinix sp.]|nr:RelA/SpoT domain protein [Herbinix sp.]
MLQTKHDIICESRTTDQQFYNESYLLLEGVITEVLSRLDIIRKYRSMKYDKDPIEHCKARIKSAESMQEKLRRRNLPVTVENALSEIYDAAGIRVVCTASKPAGHNCYRGKGLYP